eukprot:Gb_33467 [translate_table: standard]
MAYDFWRCRPFLDNDAQRCMQHRCAYEKKYKRTKLRGSSIGRHHDSTQMFLKNKIFLRMSVKCRAVFESLTDDSHSRIEAFFQVMMSSNRTASQLSPLVFLLICASVLHASLGIVVKKGPTAPEIISHKEFTDALSKVWSESSIGNGVYQIRGGWVYADPKDPQKISISFAPKTLSNPGTVKDVLAKSETRRGGDAGKERRTEDRGADGKQGSEDGGAGCSDEERGKGTGSEGQGRRVLGGEREDVLSGKGIEGGGVGGE